MSSVILDYHKDILESDPVAGRALINLNSKHLDKEIARINKVPIKSLKKQNHKMRNLNI